MWTFKETNDPEELSRRLDFLSACLSNRGDARFLRIPSFVPGVLLLKKTVYSDAPLVFDGKAVSGLHNCVSNRWGAVSVIADNGRLLGIRPNECVVMAMVPNPHAAVHCEVISQTAVPETERCGENAEPASAPIG